MSDLVLDADAVGQVITYVAPGFLARVGYRTRYPGGVNRSAGEVVILAIALSLPLVALVNAWPGVQKPTQLGYVAALLGLSLVLGYAAAYLRDRKWARTFLGWLGHRIEPEGSIYAQTLKQMSAGGTVFIELKDGRQFWGVPARGPNHEGDGIHELYIVYPEAKHGDEWKPVGGPGIILPLSEIGLLVLMEDPTGSVPEATPADQSNHDMELASTAE